MWKPCALPLGLLVFMNVCAVILSCSIEDVAPVVHTKQGSVQGCFLESRLGRKFYSFRGIRYAEPPVGDLRFRPPVEHSWEGVFDATEDGPLCPQPGFNNTSEDCLRINIFTPHLPHGKNNPKLPVIVYLHDGGFYVFGAITPFRGPHYFLDHDVVLVTFNYRLGSLGFLSTGDGEAPGNYAMKDQVHALKWVQKNIEAFGGDKDSVTLLGYSAGGWSITLHMVSPMARGLFHRGIMMSGTALGIYPLPHGQLDLAKKQASLVGCPIDTTKNLVSCLRTKSSKEIADSYFGFTELGNGPGFLMSPVIEDDFGQERYLPDHPVKMIEEKNFYPIPLIGGRNKDEFAFSAYNLLSNETATGIVNDDFEKWAPKMFIYEQGTPKSKIVTREVKRFYLNNQPLSNETVEGLAKAFADTVVGFPVHKTVSLLAKNMDKPVYYYEVTYLGGVTDFYLPGSNGTIPYGVVHQDETKYMFHVSALHPLFDENYPVEARAVAKITTLFFNFAKTGNPTPTDDELFNNVKWEPFNLQTQKYLDFGKTLEMKDHMFKERYDFWLNLYSITEQTR